MRPVPLDLLPDWVERAAFILTEVSSTAHLMGIAPAVPHFANLPLASLH